MVPANPEKQLASYSDPALPLADALLQWVGYKDSADRLAGELPHVDRRLVEIARALAAPGWGKHLAGIDALSRACQARLSETNWSRQMVHHRPMDRPEQYLKKRRQLFRRRSL